MSKRIVCVVLVFFALFFCTLGYFSDVEAAAKPTVSKNISIVFDNSGSMYSGGKKAWCRATYAMEVFASMMNKGDTLSIYPMNPIDVNGKQYTMDSPFKLTDASQATSIRNIYTDYASLTPIESVDKAIEGLKRNQSGENYLIVLSDGNTFHKNDSSLGVDRTKTELDLRFKNNAGRNMKIMYLGIGNDVVMPDTKDSEYFVKRQAKESEDVLSTLTEMCNLIFGRDSLPQNRINNNKIDLDISIKKLIVFVQGENISNLKVTKDSKVVGNLTGSAMTKYSTSGCGNHDAVPDESLQGMMVTYEDCEAGEFDIEYSGKASKIEVYYEPDVDLEFIFTDSFGNSVDPMNLYEGEYKMSFGMKDAKTGQLSDSDLLGNPKYSGKYIINGKEYEIKHEGKSGEESIELKVGDTFEAKLTVTYLSGYTISKDSTEFGWPKGGIVVASRPAGDLKMEISEGEEKYFLQKLEEGKPYKLKVYYKDTLLTGDELKAVDIKWDSDKSNALIEKTFAEDHYILSLKHKNPEAPVETKCGECNVTLNATYKEEGSNEAKSQFAFKYNIDDDKCTIGIELSVPEDYLVISDLGESAVNVLKLTKNGKKLTIEEFKTVEIDVDCGGIEYELIPDPENSAYKIQFKATEGIKEGDYQIKASASYTDDIGRTSKSDVSEDVVLSIMPFWLKALIIFLILLLLFIIIWIILHIKVYPTKAHVDRRDSSMIFDGEDVTNSTSFSAKIDNGKMNVQSRYAGSKAGIKMDVKRGKTSYLKNRQVKRAAEVKSASVGKMGTATITEINIGSVTYMLNEDSGKLERQPPSDKPFEVKHGMRVSYSGMMQNAGSMKPFTVNTKLNFKKK